MKISTIKKPQDWPQNNREAHLTNILNVCEKFINEPSFCHKELYELFYFDYKNYRDLCIQDGFLKQKTTLYLYPDFLLTNNEKIHHQTGLRRMEKLNSVSNNNFLFCKKCFQSDYSIWGDQIKEYICPICGSKDFDFIKVT